MQYEDSEIGIEPLQFGYAIVTLPGERIEEFLLHEQVEYAEKPKELYEQDLMGNLAACMENTTTGSESENSLTGEGVCIALIDSGLDVMLPCFQNEDNSSRVLFFFDQTTRTEYTQEDINAYIGEQNKTEGTQDNEKDHRICTDSRNDVRPVRMRQLRQLRRHGRRRRKV